MATVKKWSLNIMMRTFRQPKQSVTKCQWSVPRMKWILKLTSYCKRFKAGSQTQNLKVCLTYVVQQDEHYIKWMPWRNVFKFGINVHLKWRTNWLDYVGQRLRWPDGIPFSWLFQKCQEGISSNESLVFTGQRSRSVWHEKTKIMAAKMYSFCSKQSWTMYADNKTA